MPSEAGMATSAKRKAAAADGEFGVDAVVWAKMKGYPAWPARVDSLLSGGARATVEFFGTGEAATLGVTDLTAWDDAERGTRLSKKSKRKDFKQAIVEAEAASGIALSNSSKRLKAASPPADSVASPAEAGGDDQDDEIVCQVCGSAEDESTIVLCDGCPHAYHLACLTPALSSVPAGDWHCPTCTAKSEMKVDNVSASDGLSEYEQQRLENIARNEAMLRQLNIQPMQTMAPPQKTRARAVRGLKASRRSSEPVVKRERSLRLAGKTPDGAELPPTFKEPTFAEMRFAGDSHHRERIEGELKLADALREEGKGMKRKPKRGEVVEEETEEVIAQRKAESAAKFGSNLGGLSVPDQLRAAYDEDATLRMLQGLQVRDTDVAKVVPERIFSMDFHPSRSKLLVAVGDKWGSIGFFDPDAEDEEDAVTLFSVHTRPIPCLRFDANDSAKLYSSSYDNTLRCLDVAAMEFTEVFAGDADYHLAYSTYSRDHKTAYLAFNTGELGLVDLRAGKEMKQ